MTFNFRIWSITHILKHEVIFVQQFHLDQKKKKKEINKHTKASGPNNGQFHVRAIRWARMFLSGPSSGPVTLNLNSGPNLGPE